MSGSAVFSGGKSPCSLSSMDGGAGVSPAGDGGGAPPREADESAFALDLQREQCAQTELQLRSVKRSVSCGTLVPQLADRRSAQAAQPPEKSRKRASRGIETSPVAQAILADFRFDWFAGVIPSSDGTGCCRVGGREEREAIARGIEFLERHGLRFGEPGGGGKGYAVGLPFVVGVEGKEKVAAILSGSRTGGMPNLGLSGGNGLCAELAPLLQREFQGFLLTRADCCYDIKGADAMGAWRLLHAMSTTFCAGRRMGPPDVRGTEESGRTFYLGAEGAPVRLRVYEKGHQLRAQGREDADLDHLRIEFQFTDVKGPEKPAFGALSPGEMVQARIWPRKWLAECIATMGWEEAPQIAPIKVARNMTEGTVWDTVKHCARQYSKAFARAAYSDIVTSRFGGDVAAASVSLEDLLRKMAAIFLRAIREEGAVERVLVSDRMDISETAQQRAEAVARRQQALRMDEMRVRARARENLAGALRYGVASDIALAHAAAERAREAVVEATDNSRPEVEKAFIRERRRRLRQIDRLNYFTLKARRARKKK